MLADLAAPTPCSVLDPVPVPLAHVLPAFAVLAVVSCLSMMAGFADDRLAR